MPHESLRAIAGFDLVVIAPEGTCASLVQPALKCLPLFCSVDSEKAVIIKDWYCSCSSTMPNENEVNSSEGSHGR